MFTKKNVPNNNNNGPPFSILVGGLCDGSGICTLLIIV